MTVKVCGISPNRLRRSNRSTAVIEIVSDLNHLQIRLNFQLKCSPPEDFLTYGFFSVPISNVQFFKRAKVHDGQF